MFNKHGEKMSKHGNAGKGSAPRKNQNYDAYADNYDRIFGRGKKEKQKRALDEMVRLSEELGLYDDIPNPMIKRGQR
jgi:hypothetical protein